MSRYRPGSATTTDLSATQRWLRIELGRIAQVTDALQDMVLYLAQRCVEIFSVAAYGALSQDGTSEEFSLGATWTPVTWWTDQTLAPRGVSYGANGTMIVDFPGVWMVTVQIPLTHAAVNNGRSFQLRFRNLDAGANAGSIYTIGTGRDQEVTNVMVSGLVDIPSSAVGQSIQVQIGSGDTYTNVTAENANYSMSQVGEYREDLVDSGEFGL